MESLRAGNVSNVRLCFRSRCHVQQVVQLRKDVQSLSIYLIRAPPSTLKFGDYCHPRQLDPRKVRAFVKKRVISESCSSALLDS